MAPSSAYGSSGRSASRVSAGPMPSGLLWHGMKGGHISAIRKQDRHKQNFSKMFHDFTFSTLHKGIINVYGCLKVLLTLGLPMEITVPRTNCCTQRERLRRILLAEVCYHALIPGCCALLPLPFKPAGLENTPAAHALQVAWRSRCERVTDFQPESCGKRLGQSQPGASVSLAVKPADNSA